MAQRQRLHGLQIAVAEFGVVGHVAPADTSGFDRNLEFVGSWVRKRTSFLVQAISIRGSQLPQLITTPTSVGIVGCGVRREAYKPQISWPM